MRLKKDPPPPMSDKELQERRRMAELAAMMFDRAYRGLQRNLYFQGMSTEEFDQEIKNLTPEEFYQMVSQGIDNPQRFYNVVSQYLNIPDKAKAAMKPPSGVYSDLANRVIYSGQELLSTEGQGTAFNQQIELADLIQKYPEAVTGVRGGFEGTVEYVDVESPSQTMTPVKKRGLPQNQIVATDERQLQEMLLDERKKGREAVRVMKSDQQMRTGASPDYDVHWDEKRKQWKMRPIPQEEVDRYKKENRIFVTPRISF